MWSDGLSKSRARTMPPHTLRGCRNLLESCFGSRWYSSISQGGRQGAWRQPCADSHPLSPGSACQWQPRWLLSRTPLEAVPPRNRERAGVRADTYNGARGLQTRPCGRRRLPRRPDVRWIDGEGPMRAGDSRADPTGRGGTGARAAKRAAKVSASGWFW